MIRMVSIHWWRYVAKKEMKYAAKKYKKNANTIYTNKLLQNLQQRKLAENPPN